MNRSFALFLTLLSFVVLPAYASATLPAQAGALPAGFAPTSVWLSKTSLTGGDSATIYTVVYDSSDSPLHADVDFSVDGTSIGVKNVSLDAGATQVVSTAWTAVAGTHAITANIENAKDANGAALAIENTSAGSVSVTVANPPPPPAAVAALTSALPIVTNAAQSVYNAAESARLSAAAALTDALATSTPALHTTTTPNPGEVLGAETENIPTVSATSSNPSIFSTAWRGFLSALLYIVNFRVLFYLLLIVVVYLMYRLVRVMFSERRFRH